MRLMSKAGKERRVMSRKVSVILTLGTLALTLAACGGNQDAAAVRARYQGVDIANADKIGVNGFLWRAALDTLAFMPLKSTDSSGGVIVTDWYVNPDVHNERFSMTIYIKDKTLRADALDLALHRQTFDAQRGWIDAPVQQQTVSKLEDAILIRARELRLGTTVRNG